jgi:hypothetical protein
MNPTVLSLIKITLLKEKTHRILLKKKLRFNQIDRV